jgi:hypothetical protein
LEDISRITALALAAPPFETPTGHLVGHGEFAAALDAYSAAFVALYAGKTRLIKLVTSPARYQIVGFMMSLHAWRDSANPKSGATVGQIHTLAAATRIASPGRVNAILANFTAGGFAMSVAVPGDRRLRRVEPAAPLLDHRADWLRLYLHTVDRLFPGRGYAARFESDPEFGWEWQRQWMLRAIQFAGRPEGNADIHAFIARDGGHMLLMALLASADANGATALPFSESARRFGLSRQHIVNFVTDMEQAGFLRTEGEGGHRMQLAPDFVSRYRRMMAILFEATEHVCARATAALRLEAAA